MWGGGRVLETNPRASFTLYSCPLNELDFLFFYTYYKYCRKMHADFTFGHHLLPSEGEELILKAQDLTILSVRSILIHLHLF